MQGCANHETHWNCERNWRDWHPKLVCWEMINAYARSVSEFLSLTQKLSSSHKSSLTLVNLLSNIQKSCTICVRRSLSLSLSLAADHSWWFGRPRVQLSLLAWLRLPCQSQLWQQEWKRRTRHLVQTYHVYKHARSWLLHMLVPTCTCFTLYSTLFFSWSWHWKVYFPCWACKWWEQIPRQHHKCSWHGHSPHRIEFKDWNQSTKWHLFW